MSKRANKNPSAAGPEHSRDGLIRPAGDRPVRASGLRIGAWLAVGLWLSVALVFTAATLQRGGDADVWLPVFATVGITGALLSLPVLYAGAVTSGLRANWRFTWLAIAALGAACTQSVTDLAVHTVVEQALYPDRAPPNWRPTLSFNMMLYIWIYALYGTAVALVFTLLDARESERRLLQLQSSVDRARLEALRSQINPHFLFNALNAAVSLIGLGRSAEAEAVLIRLSSLFRRSLVSPSVDGAPLAAEFETIEAYLEIESIRFGERLSVTIDLPEELRDAAWPHFLLQPLVESAIQRGASGADLTTRVSVRAAGEGDRLAVMVENDPMIDWTSSGEDTALSNIRERLAVQFGSDAGVETYPRDGASVIRIHLPLTLIPA